MCLFPVHSCQQAHKIKSAKPLEVLAGLSALSFSLSLSACMQNGSPRLAPLTNSICQKVFLTCRHEIYCFIIYPFFNLKPSASLPLSCCFFLYYHKYFECLTILTNRLKSVANFCWPATKSRLSFVPGPQNLTRKKCL